MAHGRRDEWAKRVERWKDSGLTLQEFATETGLNAHTLKNWRWKLSRRGTAGRSCGRVKGPQRVRDGKVAPAFVEVAAIGADTGGGTSAAARPAEPLELVLHDGLCVRVPVQFDADALRRLVAALGGR